MRLLKSDAVIFNGGKKFTLVTKAEVLENLSAQFELNMTVLRSDPVADYIEIGSIIMAKPNMTEQEQPFVVEQINKNIDGEISVFAVHIAQHRAKLIPVLPFTATSLAQTLTRINSYVTETNIFSITTDKSSGTDFELKQPCSLRQLMGGMEGSILDVYGGEYAFDRLNIRLLNKRGRKNAKLKVMYGRNLTKYDQTNEFSWTNSVTGILPYYIKEEEGQTTLVIGDTQYSQYANYFPYKKTVVHDFTSKFNDTVPTKAQLNAEAISYLQGKGLPQGNIKASFADISTLPEYDSLKNQIQYLTLGDEVNVIYTEFSTNVKSRIIELKYNVLENRYETMEIGDSSTTINQAISDSASSDTFITNVTSGEKNMWYGTCADASTVQNRTVTTNTGDFVLAEGNMVRVAMTSANSYNGVTTINVDGTGAVSVARVIQSTTTRYYWRDGEVVDFVYNGTYFVMSNKAAASTTYYGLTKLANSVTSTSNSLAATANAVKSAYDRGDSAYTLADSANTLATSAQALAQSAHTYTQSGNSITLPSGFIIKWGNTSVNNNATKTVTFPTAFPTACIIVIAVNAQVGFGAADAVSVGQQNASSFKVAQVNGASASMGINWIAFGY